MVDAEMVDAEEKDRCGYLRNYNPAGKQPIDSTNSTIPTATLLTKITMTKNNNNTAVGGSTPSLVALVANRGKERVGSAEVIIHTHTTYTDTHK